MLLLLLLLVVVGLIVLLLLVVLPRSKLRRSEGRAAASIVVIIPQPAGAHLEAEAGPRALEALAGLESSRNSSRRRRWSMTTFLLYSPSPVFLT